jgi:hypothetical protein
MNFMDFIANAGVAYNSADQTIQKNQQAQLELERARRRDETERIQLEELRRNQELQGRMRELAATMGTTPAQPQKDLNIPLPYQVDDEGNQLPPATRTVAPVAGRPDQYKLYRDQATMLRAAGKFDEADGMDKRAKIFEQEGLLDLARDLHAGKDPATTIRNYSSRGTDAIPDDAKYDPKTGRLTYTRNGVPTEFNAIRHLTESGALKKPNVQAVPQGSKLMNLDTGETVADNPKPTDNWQEKEALKLKNQKELKTFEAELAEKKGKKNATALIQNIEYLAPMYGDDKRKVFEMLELNAKGKTPEQFERDLVRDLLKTELNAKPDEVITKARDITKSLYATQTNTAPGAKPPQGPELLNSVPATSAGQPPAKIGNHTFSGKYTARGKPLYQDAQGNLFVGD